MHRYVAVRTMMKQRSGKLHQVNAYAAWLNRRERSLFAVICFILKTAINDVELLSEASWMRLFPHPNPSPEGRGTFTPFSLGRRAGDEGAHFDNPF